ncbi:MAG: N-acetylmuramidase family protein [Pyrinomonadaceae bacterium]
MAKFDLNPRSDRRTGLRLIDYFDAAEHLGVPVAYVRAVDAVESAGSGFLPSGRPKMLFEGHIFHELTGGKFSRNFPTISYPRWTKQFYKGGEAEYRRLEMAMDLDPAAALKSASWGRFQILGRHHGACGYALVESFVASMFDSESNHLDAFVDFVEAAGLDDELQRADWAGFARGYNGPAYRRNQYDVKLANAAKKFSKIYLADKPGVTTAKVDDVLKADCVSADVPCGNTSLDDRYLTVSLPVETDTTEDDGLATKPVSKPASIPPTVSSETSTSNSTLADHAGSSASPEGAEPSSPALTERLNGTLERVSRVQDKIDAVNGVVSRVNGSTKSLLTMIWGHIVQIFWMVLTFFAAIPLKYWAVGALIFAALCVVYIYRQTVLDRLRLISS